MPLLSLSAKMAGVGPVGQMHPVQDVPPPPPEPPLPTVTVIEDVGISRLPLSSTARLKIVNVAFGGAVKVYVQEERPVAGCHVSLLSVEISTPPTTPPTSDAVPATLMVAPLENVAPLAGEVIVEVGATVSVDLLAAIRPACSVTG